MGDLGDVILYLLAFSAGMVAVAALPRPRLGGDGRTWARRQAREGMQWVAQHRMAVAVWLVGCLLTGVLASLVALAV